MTRFKTLLSSLLVLSSFHREKDVIQPPQVVVVGEGASDSLNTGSHLSPVLTTDNTTIILQQPHSFSYNLNNFCQDVKLILNHTHVYFYFALWSSESGIALSFL